MNRARPTPLDSGPFEPRQAAEMSQDLLHADLVAQGGIINTAGRCLDRRGRQRLDRGLVGRCLRSYCGSCRGDH